MSKKSREQEQSATLGSSSGAAPTFQLLQPISRPVLGWLPDEYFFSLVSRNHAYWGHPREADTIEVFFGTREETACSPDSSDIDIFVAKTEGRLGGGKEILEGRTLLRLYRIFMDGDELERYLCRPRTAATSQLKFPMALWNGLYTAKHPLKACAACINDDLKDSGTPYWRVSHQYPGIWVCTKHSQALQKTSVTTSSVNRFHFYSPKVELLQPAPDVIDSKTIPRLARLAILLCNMSNSREQGVALLVDVRQRFIDHLSAARLIGVSGRLSVIESPAERQLCEKFVNVCMLLREFTEFRLLPSNVVSARHTLDAYIGGRAKISIATQIALLFWFITLPFWTKQDEAKWCRSLLNCDS